MENESDYTNCEDCGARILKGDVRYLECEGKSVCEYCYDKYDKDYY